MRRRWRLLVWAAAFEVAAGVSAASAQTVYLRNAPPNAPVEVFVNVAKAGAGTTDGGGEAQVPFNLRELAGKEEMDANVSVDACGTTRRVFVVDAGRQPPPAESGCERRQVTGLFLVRPLNTLVVDVGGSTPKMLLVKGKYTPPKVTAEGEETHQRRPSPTGMVVYGAGGLASFRDAVFIFCGTVQDCTGKNMRPAYALGATFWLTRVIGVDASFIKPAKVTASGSGRGYRFKSELNTQFVTIAGKVGAPIGPVRIYGKAGWNYHRATQQTGETIDPVTVTVDGSPQTFAGGTQAFTAETSGWGWLFTGGMEGWIKPSIAIYGEFGMLKAKGDQVGGGEVRMDDRVTLVLAGLRFRIGPK